MKKQRKRCLVLRMVGSSNPFRATRKILKIQKNSKPAAQVHWQRIETLKESN